MAYETNSQFPEKCWSSPSDDDHAFVPLVFLVPFVVNAHVLGDPVDVAQDFQRLENVYFIGSRVTSFDTTTGQGTLQWDRCAAWRRRGRDFVLQQDPQGGKVKRTIKVEKVF